MFDFEFWKYIYWEYSIAVLLFSELIKLLVKGSTSKFLNTITFDRPKWMVLIVAIILGIGDWIFIDKGAPNYYQLLISFALAVVGYDYGLKLIKDLIKKIRDVSRDTPGE
jgi:hypothetical protein